MTNETSPAISREIARKVLEVVDKGLVHGLGKPVPGQMCVEAAVCYAMGLPHSDKPSCVGYAVRAYKIALNDKAWSSDAARATGMRRVAVAQLGSDLIDQRAFAQEVTLQVTRQLLPIALRAAASSVPAHKDALETAAVACEAITAFAQVSGVVRAARSAAQAAYADDAAAQAAYAAAAQAAYAAADAAYAAAAAAQAAYAADDAAAQAAYAAAAAAQAAYAAADAAYAAKRDSILSRAAEIGVQALIKLGSAGCAWLDLCE